MRRNRSFFMCTVRLCVVFLVAISLFSTKAEAATTFSDVPKNHYAVEAIQWAYERGIISGYGNGTFGPNNEVTEQQFAKMLVNTFELGEAKGILSPEKPVVNWAHAQIVTQEDLNKDWSAEYYNQLASYGVPLNGYFLPKVRTNSMQRGTVAQSLAYLVEGRMDLKDSITFLHKNGITVWQNSNEYTIPNKFGYLNNLTRAQVVTFLYRLSDKSMNQLSRTAQSTYTNYDSGANKFNELAHDGQYIVDGRLQSASGVSSWTYTATRPFIDYEKMDREEILEGWLSAKLPISVESGTENVTKEGVDYFYNLLGKDLVHELFGKRGYEVNVAEIDSRSEYLRMDSEKGRIGFSIGTTKPSPEGFKIEDIITYNSEENPEDAVLILNHVYGYKFKADDLRVKSTVELNERVTLFPFDTANGVLIYINKE